MKIILYRLKRTHTTHSSTMGELEVCIVSPKIQRARIFYSPSEIKDESEGRTWMHLAYTLEPPMPPYYSDKMPKPAAIPAGIYRLEQKHSHKFRGPRWFLQDVPHFEGIMIHVGNFPRNTQGCILVGDKLGRDYLDNSRLADNRIRRRMNEISKTGCNQYIQVVDASRE